jgi:hypothetical protein
MTDLPGNVTIVLCVASVCLTMFLSIVMFCIYMIERQK